MRRSTSGLVPATSANRLVIQRLWSADTVGSKVSGCARCSSAIWALLAEGASTCPVNSFSFHGSAANACCSCPGSCFHAAENRISQVICVSRRVMAHVPGWTSPGDIASATSAGTSGGAGIHARIVLMMPSLVAAEIAPIQIIRKCTACSSAISCLASGETPASWPRSFSSYRRPGVRSGCATKASSSSSRCSLVHTGVPGVNSESPGPSTSFSHRLCSA